MKCKYKFKYYEGECKNEADQGSSYCIWHKPIEGKDFVKIDIKEKDLREAYLVKAKLNKQKFEDIDLRRADFQEAKLVGAEFKRVKLNGANFRKAVILGGKFENVNLGSANFQEAELGGTKFKGILSFGAKFQGAYLGASDFSENRNLLTIHFQGADLGFTNFENSNLEGINFQGCNLARAKLRNATVTYSDFRGTILYQTEFKGVKNLRDAKLPDKQVIEEIIADEVYKTKWNFGEEEINEYIQKIINKLFNKKSFRGIFNENTLKFGNYIKERYMKFINFMFRLSGSSNNLYLAKAIYQSALDVYINLKNYFKEDGSYDLSGRYFIGEFRVRGKIEKTNLRIILKKIILKINIFKRQRENVKENFIYLIGRALKSLFSYLLNKILDLTSLYGEDPLRVILTAIGIIFFYAFLYLIKSGILSGTNENVKGFLNHLYFSIVTFTTLGYGDLRPAPHMRIIAGTEAFLGAFILAYFVVTISRKIMR